MRPHKNLTRYNESLGASVTPPILISNTFNYADASSLDSGARLIYARQSNPASYILEHTMMGMDGAIDAMAFSSGMAAVTTLFQSLREGDNAVVPATIYWPIRHWIERFAAHFRFTVNWVPDASSTSILRGVTSSTKLIWVELLANPSLGVTDIVRIAGLKPDSVILAVDATCVTPAICKPLNYGADIVMYSGSKSLGGHNDLMAGLLVTRHESEFWQTIRDLRWLFGNGLGAMDSSRLNQALMTLPVRIKRSSESALKIARTFEHHPNVSAVIYPGLETHPQHQLAKTFFNGGQFGPLLGMKVKTSVEGCKRICRAVTRWSNSTGYGAVYSQIEHRFEAEYCVTQSSENYLRLSVGLEPVELLIEDLQQAIECSVNADSVAA